MPAKTLSVQLFAQEQSKWCWAAVSAGVASYFRGSPLGQCEVVNHILDLKSCCIDGSTAVCDQGHRTWEALDTLGHLASREDGPCDLATIKTEIDAGRPIGVGIDWLRGTGHVVLVIGYQQDDRLDIRDPGWSAGNEVEVYHENLLTHYRKRGSTWARTYYTKP